MSDFDQLGFTEIVRETIEEEGIIPNEVRWKKYRGKSLSDEVYCDIIACFKGYSFYSTLKLSRSDDKEKEIEDLIAMAEFIGEKFCEHMEGFDPSDGTSYGTTSRYVTIQKGEVDEVDTRGNYTEI